MLAAIDVAMLLVGVGLVGAAARLGAQGPIVERFGGVLLVVGLIGLGLIVARHR